jgi:DNA-3-methyladenine glycosylase II
LPGVSSVQVDLVLGAIQPETNSTVSPDDLALRRSIQARYCLDHLPDPAEVADIARPWRPYRSLASSLLLAAAKPS